MSDLLVIVPSRGRPQSVAGIVQAWRDTDAYADATLLFALDEDDPSAGEYRAQSSPEALMLFSERWQPMVPKLDLVAKMYANLGEVFALGFAGDDHLPRTSGWAARFVAALRQLGTGVVYGDDLLQRERLCTAWAMTSDIVRALGRMVPAPVEHMYCDNAVMELARAAGCLRYLPRVVIEHMHPLAGKADWDPGYARVNRAEQFQADEQAWRTYLANQFADDVAKVRVLREVTACQ